jgi:phosphopantothenoylcysteine synthetase/decarboxylase
VPSFGSEQGNVLYLIVCAAPPARRSVECVETLQAAGWDICVIATPAALPWVDLDALAKATGHPVRSEFRRPDDPEFAPRGDAVLVAPASFNTINKAATGINDNLALGLINEALGSPTIPIAVAPWVNGALSEHPAYTRNLAVFRDAGAHIVNAPTGDSEDLDEVWLSTANWLDHARAST